MAGFRFYKDIEVRYGDLDPQGHVNNSRYLTYFEHARIHYLLHLGLWRGGSFSGIGIILADAQITFLSPAKFGQRLKVGTRVTRLGNKSITMEYCLEADDIQEPLATGSSVLVTYDYPTEKTIPIPQNWREAIISFENFTV